MFDVSKKLIRLIETNKPRLLAITEPQAAEKPYNDKWSIKEILGHLIDSAANNHQRFVRMQEVKDLGEFRYNQEHWVKSQHYHDKQWEDIVHTWYYYNHHLAHVIAHIDETTLNNTCDMGYPLPATLQFIAEDYVRHLQHHLNQIFSGADPRQREKWTTQLR